MPLAVATREAGQPICLRLPIARVRTVIKHVGRYDAGVHATVQTVVGCAVVVGGVIVRLIPIGIMGAIDSLARIEAYVLASRAAQAVLGEIAHLIGIARNIGIGQELVTVHLRADVGADVLVAAYHLVVALFGGILARCTQCQDVEFEGVGAIGHKALLARARPVDGRLRRNVVGCRGVVRDGALAGKVHIAACLEAHHETILLVCRSALVGHLLVGHRGLEVFPSVFGIVAVREQPAGVLRGVVGVVHRPIGRLEHLGHIGRAAVGFSARARRHKTLGKHDRHYGQGHIAHLAAVHRIGVVEPLPAAAVRIIVAAGLVRLLVVGQAIPPVAILHVHVQLASVVLALQVVGGGISCHAVAADRRPRAHERLTHAAARARLHIVDRLLLFAHSLIGVLPLHAGGVHHALASGLFLDGHRVVLHRATPHRRHVRRAVGAIVARIHVAAARAVPVTSAPHVVHAEGLAVVQIAI